MDPAPQRLQHEPRFVRMTEFSASGWRATAGAIRELSFPSSYFDSWDRNEPAQDFLLLAAFDELVVGYAFVDHGLNPGNCYLREVAVMP